MEKPLVDCDRTCFSLQNDVYRTDQFIDIKGVETGYDATGPYTVVGWIQKKRGEISVVRDGQRLPILCSNLLFVLPPGSVVELHMNDTFTINSASSLNGQPS